MFKIVLSEFHGSYILQSYFVIKKLVLHVSGVLEEAEFYNVADLVALVKQDIADRDDKLIQVCYITFQHFVLSK